MQRKESRAVTIDRFIMDTVKNKQPDTVDELVKLVQKEFSISKEEAMKHIIDLNNNGQLTLEELSFPPTHRDYLYSTKATWYWIIASLSLATTITVFTIPEDAFPIVYIRYLLGSIFVLFLPGFCLIKALFPEKEFDNVEKTALSVGMSLAIVPLTSFLLNYTPWGITTTTVTFSLLALTITFASIALLRGQEAGGRKTLN